MSKDLVTIRDVRVELGGNAILQGVDAALERGKITALIGPNGCGKTTLLRAVLKEVPYTGRIKFHCGHDHSRPMPEHIGYVPQKLNIDARLPLTVRDLLALAMQRRPLFLGVSRRTELLMIEMLKRVWVSPELLGRPVERLSGGELQRVLLALALQPDPELLLMDEPAAGIDFQHQDPFYKLIAELNAQTGVTILLVSHDLSVVTKRAHHVICVRDGRVQCQGLPQDIITEEMLAQTFGSELGVFLHHHGHH